MKSIVIKFVMSLVLIYGALVLKARPAAAIIFGDLSLQNQTPFPLTISGAIVDGGSSGTWYNQDLPAGDVTRPDGSPPGLLPPNETMDWGSQHNGGLFQGTGGQFDVAIMDTTQLNPVPVYIGTLRWSVPWGQVNGNVPNTYCNISWSTPTSNSPFKVNWSFGVGGDGENGDGGCNFWAAMVGGSSPAMSIAGGLSGGQTVSWHKAVTSVDGTTTFAVQNFGAFGSSLVATDNATGAQWFGGAGAIMALMQGNGNLVAFDINGNAVWSTGTAGYGGAWFEVDDGALTIKWRTTFKGHSIIKEPWYLDISTVSVPH